MASLHLPSLFQTQGKQSPYSHSLLEFLGRLHNERHTRIWKCTQGDTVTHTNTWICLPNPGICTGTDVLVSHTSPVWEREDA